MSKKAYHIWVIILSAIAILTVGLTAFLIFSADENPEIAPVLAVVPGENGEDAADGYQGKTLYTTGEIPGEVEENPEPFNTPGEIIDDAPRARLAFVGDVMCHGAQLDAARISPGVYDFHYAFRYIAPYIRAADFAVANLETTLVHSGFAGWPLFQSPRALAEALLYAGFDHVTTGNNHSFDAGVAGVRSTIEILNDVGLGFTGTFLTPECREEITIVEVNGFTFALLNFTMHTNAICLGHYNFMVKIVYHDLVEQSRIDYEMIRASMARARALEPDFIVVLPHIGIEYYGTMNRAGGGHQWDTFDRNDTRWVNWMRTMHLFVEEGADIVMNHHPHTLLPAEFVYVTNEDGTTRRAFLAYSMANFVSAQRREPRETSAVFYVDVRRDFYGYAYIYAASHVPVWVREYDPTRDPLRCFTVLPVAETLHRVQNAPYYEITDLRPQDIERLHYVLRDVTHMLSGEPIDYPASEYPITRYRRLEQFPGLPLWGTLPWR
ncbi:MAG: CapA family protein [Defluviitaleaceae bacterium]|nr:CapA family protein [Defluviitaleaceae bacterium]